MSGREKAHLHGDPVAGGSRVVLQQLEAGVAQVHVGLGAVRPQLGSCAEGSLSFPQLPPVTAHTSALLLHKAQVQRP